MPRLMLYPASARRSRMVSLSGNSLDNTSLTSKKSPFSKDVVREFPTNSTTSSYTKSIQIGDNLSTERKFDQLSLGTVESIDLTREAALPRSSSTASCEPPHPKKWESYVISGLPENRRKKQKRGECTPDLLELSQSPSEVGTHNSSSLSSSCHAKRPAMSSREKPRKDIKLSERAIVNKACDDSSSDGWLDIDALLPDAGLEPSPLSNKSKVRRDGDKEAKGQFIPKPFPGSEARLPSDIAQSSAPRPYQNAESLGVTEVSSVQQEDDSFWNFMASDLEALAQLISLLKNMLHNNAETFYQQAIEGRPPPDLITANKDLVSQITSLETLHMSRIAYHNCATRKENLKRRLVLAISEGSDPRSMPELARSQVLEAKMRKIEVQICELLQAEIYAGPRNPDIEELSTWQSKSLALK